MTAKLSGSFNERADPKVQLERAIIEAQEQRRRLREQAANVIHEPEQTEMRLAEDATNAGDATKSSQYTSAAEAFANRMIALEHEIDGSKSLHLQATQAANQAKMQNR